jgi:hypothetical protein
MSIVEHLKQLKAREWNPRAPASLDELKSLEQSLGVQFPADFRELLLYSDGGSIYGHTTRLILFSVDELDVYVREAEYEKDLPGMITIGTDSGDAIFFFDPYNRLERGAFAVFIADLGALSLKRFACVGQSITEVITRLLNNENLSDLLPRNRPPE